jgi:hypothetical protein
MSWDKFDAARGASANAHAVSARAHDPSSHIEAVRAHQNALMAHMMSGNKEKKAAEHQAAMRHHEEASKSVAPATAHSGGSAEKINKAYDDLRASTKLKNVNITEIIEKSGVSREEVHAFLRNEAVAHRANATVGEPTAWNQNPSAQKKQDANALELEGKAHYQVQLHRKGDW